MLTVDLPSGKISIEFRHTFFKDPQHLKGVSKNFLNGKTDCDIYAISQVGGVDQFNLLCCGLGLCKWPDRWSKALGRKQALTSALRTKVGKAKPVFNRTERYLIWQAYWAYIESTTPNPPTLVAEIVEFPVPVPVHQAGEQLDLGGHQITGP